MPSINIERRAKRALCAELGVSGKHLRRAWKLARRLEREKNVGSK